MAGDIPHDDQQQQQQERPRRSREQQQEQRSSSSRRLTSSSNSRAIQGAQNDDYNETNIFHNINYNGATAAVTATAEAVQIAQLFMPQDDNNHSMFQNDERGVGGGGNQTLNNNRLLSYYCHVCRQLFTAQSLREITASDSNEVSCAQCLSTFIEIVNNEINSNSNQNQNNSLTGNVGNEISNINTVHNNSTGDSNPITRISLNQNFLPSNNLGFAFIENIFNQLINNFDENTDIGQPARTSEEILRIIPFIKYSQLPIEEGHHNECPVCLEAFADDERIRILACRHTFHSDCIITWLERNTSCPMCRKLIEYNELLAMPESQQNLAADNTNDEYNDANA